MVVETNVVLVVTKSVVDELLENVVAELSISLEVELPAIVLDEVVVLEAGSVDVLNGSRV